MKIILLIALFIAPIIGGAQTLSPDAQISVLTLGPGTQELYAAFGHSAIRVKDEANQFDIVYNYGSFDYEQPNFYANFFMGRPLYRLAVGEYNRFEYSYKYYNRSIYEQVLNLTPTERQKLFDFLQNNALEQNANYVYDYFYDNCATRVRDVFETVFSENIVFDTAHVNTPYYSLRELTDIYIKKNQQWGDLAIDLCLGTPMDETIGPRAYMFLPDYVQFALDNTSLEHDGKLAPIVSKFNVVFEATPSAYDKQIMTPSNVFWLLLVLGVLLTWFEKRKRKKIWVFDFFLTLLTGVLGIALFLLWTTTSHQAAANNLNLLWAFPLNAIVAFFMFSKPVWLRKYFYAVSFLLLITIIGWAWWPQALHFALKPLVVLLMIRFTDLALWLRSSHHSRPS